MIDHSPKQEGGGHYSSSSSQWLRLKDPRIVRVSRAFGGKDRHSKVCTVRGLRDRRVRLSVPTAIQLYDLQDRLGLNQPSKVVDWLLNAAKHDIDELPPLPNINIHIPSNNNFTTTLGGFPSSMMINHNVEDEQQLFNNKGIIHQLGEGISSTQKPREQEEEEEDIKQGSNNKEGDIANVLGGNNYNNSVLLPIRPNHHPSFLGLLNNATMPTIGNYQWESSSSDVGQLGNNSHHIGFTNQQDNHGNTSSSSCSNNNNPHSHHHHQILGCPNPPHHGSTTTQSYFPCSSSSSSHHVTAAMEFMDPIRQMNNHYQMLASSSSSHNPSFSFAMMMAPRLHTSRESPSHHHKHHEFPSK